MINIVNRAVKFFLKNFSSHLILAFIIVQGVLVFSGCNKDNNIGLEVQPPGDKIHVFTDSSTTFSIYTVKEDPLTTTNHSYFMLGSYVDPIFGKSKADFMTQVLLTTSHLRFGENPVADSLVLYLDYGVLIGEDLQYYYGDTTTSQEIRIYEIEEDIYYDSTYYSNQNVENFYTPGNEIASLTYSPQPSRDSLAIPLSIDLANRILNADTTNLEDNTGFLEFFKGIYLQTDMAMSDGSIVYFDILSSKTRLTLYFSTDTEDSLKYDFDISDNCARFSLFEHDYEGSVVESSIDDTVNQTNEVYIQSMSGTKALVKFELNEELVELAQKGISINKAELVFEIANDPSSENFRPPDNLFMTSLNLAGQDEFLPDYYLSMEHFDGNYYSSQGVYKFNIARHIKTLLDPDFSRRKVNYGLHLFNSFNRVISDRLVLKGGLSEGSIKLNIVYSEL